MLQGREMAGALHNAADYLDGKLFPDTAERCRAGAAEIVRLLDVIRTRDKAIKELQAEIFVSEGSDVTKIDALKADVLRVIGPILQGPACVELTSEQCKQLVLLEDRLAGAERTEDKDGK